MCIKWLNIDELTCPPLAVFKRIPLLVMPRLETPATDTSTAGDTFSQVPAIDLLHMIMLHSGWTPSLLSD